MSSEFRSQLPRSPGSALALLFMAAQPVAALDTGPPNPHPEGMEVHFTPEQEARLSQLATYAGTDTERLVKDAALRLIEEHAEFRAGVRRGIAQADRGELIEHEEVKARIERVLKSR